MQRAVVAAIGDAEIRQRFDELGLEVEGGTPEQFGAFVKKEAERLQKLCHTAAFRPYTNTDVIGCELGGTTKNVPEAMKKLLEVIDTSRRAGRAKDAPGVTTEDWRP